MRYTIGTVYRSCTLKIDLSVSKPCQVNLEVCDASQPNTYYIKRFRMYVPGDNSPLYVQMPVTGKNILITIWEQGKNQNSASGSFKVKEMKLLPLVRQMDVLPAMQSVHDFVPFAERFCFNAGVMPTYKNRLYVSGSGGFKIRYSDYIVDEDSNQRLTPARIGIYDKIIEVSQEKFVPMTVPMRLCILFHEFSHLFYNEDMYDEEEADLNGLHIYLALGYPRVEAIETFITTFYSSQSEKNHERLEKVKSFTKEFEKITQKNT